MYPSSFWLITKPLGLAMQIGSKVGSQLVQTSNMCFRLPSAKRCSFEWSLRPKAKASTTAFSIVGASREDIVRHLDLSKAAEADTVMMRTEDTMAGADIEVAIRIEVAAAVVDEAELTIIVITGVGEEAVLVEVEVQTIGEGQVGKGVAISRSTTWVPVVVATMHREANQITMIMSKVGIITMQLFLPWEVACLMANNSVR